MKMNLMFILLAFFAMGAFAQPSTDKANAEIAVRSLVLAQTNYDQKALDALLTSDYIEVSPLGEVDPRDKVLGFYSPELKPDPSKMTATVNISDLSIRTYYNVAIAIARFDYTMTADGKPLPPRSIRATIILRKENGNWKIASAQYTGIRPPTPPKQ